MLGHLQSLIVSLPEKAVDGITMFDDRDHLSLVIPIVIP
jgi:hypothetical protein